MIIPLLNSFLALVLKELLVIYLRASELTEIKRGIKWEVFKTTSTDELVLFHWRAAKMQCTACLLFSSIQVLITFFKTEFITHLTYVHFCAELSELSLMWKLPLIYSFYKPIAVRSYRKFNERLREILSIHKPLIYNLNGHTFFLGF